MFNNVTKFKIVLIFNFKLIYKVSVGAAVKRVSCGVDHMVALCTPYQ